MREYVLFFQPPKTKWQDLAGQETKAALASLRDVCAKILADGIVDDVEAADLHRTLQHSAGILPSIGLADLPDRFRRIFEDGVIDDEERIEVAEIAKEIVRCVDEPESKPRVAGLPYTDPSPLSLADRTVVISGTFIFGKRSKVESTLAGQGARVQPAVSRETHFLIVGSAPSAGWAHGNYGRKIEEGIRLRAQAHPVEIVSEACWRAHS